MQLSVHHYRILSSILFYSILFHSILFYSIAFYNAAQLLSIAVDSAAPLIAFYCFLYNDDECFHYYTKWFSTLD